MSDVPVGSLRRTGIILPTVPELPGKLPFDVDPPSPTTVDELSISSTVFITGDTQTTMLRGADKRVLSYIPTVDGRTLSNQIGPYAVLIPHPDPRIIAEVILPPDVASFVLNTPPIEGAMALLEALLSRIEAWSKDGCLIAARILRAITRILATYQKAITAFGADTVDLHIYISILKTIFTHGARLLGGRCNEAAGIFIPLVQQSAETVISTVLDLDVKRSDGSRYYRVDEFDDTLFVCWGGNVNFPPAGLVGELLEKITKGIILP